MKKLETLEIDGLTVSIDPENMKFNETNLNNYLQKEAGYCDNFGAYLALAERNLQNKEVMHENVYHQRFVEAKDQGGSDKRAEAVAKSDPIVVELREQVVDARYIVNRLKQHLRAWDKNHNNAQSFGHTLRREMDKLNTDIMRHAGYGNSNNNSNVDSLDDAVNQAVGFYDSAQKE